MTLLASGAMSSILAAIKTLSRKQLHRLRAPALLPAVGLATMALAIPGYAQGSDRLLELLQKKGIISDKEAADLRAEAAQTNAVSASKWKISTGIKDMELFGDLPSHFAVIGSSPASDAAGVDHVVKLSVIGAAEYQAGGGSAAGTARRARAARPLLGFDVRLARGADDERVPVGVAPAVADDLPHALRGSVDLDGCVKGLHRASSDPPRASSTHLAPRRHMDVARRSLRSCGGVRDSRARRAAASSRA